MGRGRQRSGRSGRTGRKRRRGERVSQRWGSSLSTLSSLSALSELTPAAESATFSEPSDRADRHGQPWRWYRAGGSVLCSGMGAGAVLLLVIAVTGTVTRVVEPQQDAQGVPHSMATAVRDAVFFASTRGVAGVPTRRPSDAAAVAGLFATVATLMLATLVGRSVARAAGRRARLLVARVWSVVKSGGTPYDPCVRIVSPPTPGAARARGLTRDPVFDAPGSTPMVVARDALRSTDGRITLEVSAWAPGASRASCSTVLTTVDIDTQVFDSAVSVASSDGRAAAQFVIGLGKASLALPRDSDEDSFLGLDEARALHGPHLCLLVSTFEADFEVVVKRAGHLPLVSGLWVGDVARQALLRGMVRAAVVCLGLAVGMLAWAGGVAALAEWSLGRALLYVVLSTAGLPPPFAGPTDASAAWLDAAGGTVVALWGVALLLGVCLDTGVFLGTLASCWAPRTTTANASYDSSRSRSCSMDEDSIGDGMFDVEAQYDPEQDVTYAVVGPESYSDAPRSSEMSSNRGVLMSELVVVPSEFESTPGTSDSEQQLAVVTSSSYETVLSSSYETVLSSSETTVSSGSETGSEPWSGRRARFPVPLYSLSTGVAAVVLVGFHVSGLGLSLVSGGDFEDGYTIAASSFALDTMVGVAAGRVDATGFCAMLGAVGGIVLVCTCGIVLVLAAVIARASSTLSRIPLWVWATVLPAALLLTWIVTMTHESVSAATALLVSVNRAVATAGYDASADNSALSRGITFSSLFYLRAAVIAVSVGAWLAA